MAIHAEQRTLGKSLLKLMALLARKASLLMRDARPKYTVHGAIAEISVEAYQANPESALQHIQAGRQVVVRRDDGRTLFVLGAAVPDPFPADSPDPNSSDDAAEHPESVVFSWLE